MQPEPTTGPGFRVRTGRRCQGFADPDDGLDQERAARDRAFDVGHEGEATFHKTRIDDLIHLRQLRHQRLTAVFAADTDTADQLTRRIDRLERGQDDPGETNPKDRDGVDDGATVRRNR